MNKEEEKVLEEEFKKEQEAQEDEQKKDDFFSDLQDITIDTSDTEATIKTDDNKDESNSIISKATKYKQHKEQLAKTKDTPKPKPTQENTQQEDTNKQDKQDQKEENSSTQNEVAQDEDNQVQQPQQDKNKDEDANSEELDEELLYSIKTEILDDLRATNTRIEKLAIEVITKIESSVLMSSIIAQTPLSSNEYADEFKKATISNANKSIENNINDIAQTLVKIFMPKNSENEKGIDKVNVIAEYKDFILNKLTKDTLLDIKNNTNVANEDNLFIKFDDEYLRELNISSSNFLYSSISYYKSILRAYCNQFPKTQQYLDSILGAEEILNKIKQLEIINIFEEDIYLLF